MSEQELQAANWDRFADQNIAVYGTADPTPAADFLAGLLQQGHHGGRPRALELGAGVGTVACELANRDVEVTALDISPNMVAQISQRTPSQGTLTGAVGDMADFTSAVAPGLHDLIYVITSTIYSLLTQDRQLDCFANVARNLSGDGMFVVDAYVPLRLPQITQSSRSILAVRELGTDYVDLSATTHHPAAQRLSFRELHFGDGASPTVLPVECRYIWPSEMDLMARLAGLSLQARYGGWDKRAFDSGSARHVSVYGKA